jgi:hypothetical protein
MAPKKMSAAGGSGVSHPFYFAPVPQSLGFWYRRFIAIPAQMGQTQCKVRARFS